MKNVQDVLSCALKVHPESRLAESSLKQGESLEEVASQRPNPELNSQAVVGTTRAGTQFSYLELNLAHNFELGGKRGARIERAQAELEQRKASALGAQEQVYTGTLLALYRIRQIQSELEVLKIALTSATRIQKQYHSRPRLNPEQTASLRILEISEGDYKLRSAPLEADLDRQLRVLELALGKPFEPRPELLPARKKSWPVVSESKTSEPVVGSQVQSASAELKLAQAQMGVAQSSAWPDFKIGPTFETQNQGLSSFRAIGFNLSLPLPIYHLNGAGKAFANQGMSRAELGLDATRREAQYQRDYYLKRYQGAVKALTTTLASGDLFKKHNEVERLFDRGLLPGTLMVELHRQMIDFTKSQNEQEIAAVESLARLRAYQGTLFKEQP
ncbi:MAG: TolC family protein [Methylotenera sp.]|nr:TolC family protein [Oligoflexia bacterium]